MPKVKKNGKLPKPKSKAKAERQDNIKSSSTKSKSVNQSQNVNVSVSIVKNKSGGNSKTAETNNSNNNPTNQVKKPPQPPSQNVYYQQPSSSNNNSELTTLLRDMNKELYAQRNIKALNQTPINFYPETVNSRPLFGNPRIPSYVGSNNIFEDEPFEEHYSDIISQPDSNIINQPVSLYSASNAHYLSNSSKTPSVSNSSNASSLSNSSNASSLSNSTSSNYSFLNPIVTETTYLSEQPNLLVSKPLIEAQKIEMPLIMEYEEEELNPRPLIEAQKIEIPFSVRKEEQEIGEELVSQLPYILTLPSLLQGATKSQLIDAVLKLQLVDSDGNAYTKEVINKNKILNDELKQMLEPYVERKYKRRVVLD